MNRPSRVRFDVGAFWWHHGHRPARQIILIATHTKRLARHRRHGLSARIIRTAVQTRDAMGTKDVRASYAIGYGHVRSIHTVMGFGAVALNVKVLARKS